MQYVNDDMDELFRRAAENYPLDTKSADWNKVLTALQGQTETKAVSEKKENKNRRFLWLLLLLPLALVYNRLYTPATFNGKDISKTNIEEATNGREGVQQSKNIPQGNKNNFIETNTNGIKRDNVTNKNVEQKIPGAQKETISPRQPSLQLQKGFHPSETKRLKTNASTYTAYNKVASSKQASGNDFAGSRFPDEETLNEETFLQRNYVPGIAFQKLLQDEFATSVSRSLIPSIHPPVQESKEKIRVEKQKKFYAGVMGGIDGTTIKFQGIKKAGFTYGILAGYQLNKKWSIEAGAFLENKYYYSDGKYFNTSKISMPPNSRIDEVSGNCKMYEVPLSVKYNFSSRKNSGWFAAVGSSSYFMKKENYDYDYYYGTVGPVSHHKEYKSSTNNLFSTINLSGGYRHRIGNFADLRIEPYLRMPVSGMGIGSLPLFSTGLQIGLTKKF